MKFTFSSEKRSQTRRIARLKVLEGWFFGCNYYLESLVYHFFRQLWLVLGVKLMEINSNLFSR